MSIVATEIVSDDLDGDLRQIRYRCQDDRGNWHRSGVLYTSDPAFDAEAHKAIVAQKIAARLAQEEFEELLG